MKQESINELKTSMIKTFKKIGDKKGLVMKGKIYSGNEVAENIENETELGIGMINSIINLSINLISRDKLNINEE